ncbi:hypothetical protein DEV91_101305 [Phyllobacterium brassicacearum]|nr:hypothetical protein DEV91_101305 [Phyllobacterium brassicacearum]
MHGPEKLHDFSDKIMHRFKDLKSAIYWPFLSLHSILLVKKAVR